MDRALGRGIRYLDTAPLYGHGVADSTVGQAVAKVPRDGLVISTKVGRLLREDAPRDETQYYDGVPFYQEMPAVGPVWDFSYDGIRRHAGGRRIDCCRQQLSKAPEAVEQAMCLRCDDHHARTRR